MVNAQLNHGLQICYYKQICIRWHKNLPVQVKYVCMWLEVLCRQYFFQDKFQKATVTFYNIFLSLINVLKFLIVIYFINNIRSHLKREKKKKERKV